MWMWIWFGLALTFLVAELCTIDLVAVWFAISALILGTLTFNLPKKCRVPLGRCLNDVQGSLSLTMILYILNATMQSCLFLFYRCQSLFP